MMRQATASASGLVFGFGLALSHMVDPDKVLAFLDIVGSWDPSLALVMGGALLVAAAGFPLVLRRSKPILAADFDLPTRTAIDGQLLGGAALFGLGWGLSGYCPGPAVAALAVNLREALVFLPGVIIGGLLVEWIQASAAKQAVDG